MKKLLRTFIVILLLIVVAAVVYTQAQVYNPAPVHLSPSGEKVAAIAASHVADKPAKEEVQPAPAATPPAAPAATLGTESSPIIVKLADMPEPANLAAEREKDREALKRIEHYMARIAATSLAQNFLFLFQAIIYFLMLIIIYMLLENVRKFADAATKSAEAAKKSAEMAEAAVARRSEQQHKHHIGPRKFPPHYYRKR